MSTPFGSTPIAGGFQAKSTAPAVGSFFSTTQQSGVLGASATMPPFARFAPGGTTVTSGPSQFSAFKLGTASPGSTAATTGFASNFQPGKQSAFVPPGTAFSTPGTPLGTLGTTLGTSNTPLGTTGTAPGPTTTSFGNPGTVLGTAGSTLGSTTATSGTTFGINGTTLNTARTPFVIGGAVLGGPGSTFGTAPTAAGASGAALGSMAASLGTTTTGLSSAGTALGTGGASASATGPSFISLGTANTASATGFAFGAKPTTTTPGSGFTLGAATTGAGTSLPGATVTSEAKSITTGSSGLNAPGLIVGSSVTSTGSGLPVTTASTGFTLAGFPTSAPSITSTSTPGTGFILGNATTSSSSTPAFSLGAAATSTPTTGLSIGTGSGAGFKLNIAPTASTTSTSSTSLTQTGITLPSVSTTTSTAATTTQSSIPQLTYKQLEDQINKWNVELEDLEKIFLDQANQVNQWDRVLMESGEKITSMNNDVERVKAEQKRLSDELDFIMSQQNELEENLIPLEKAVKEQPVPTPSQHADIEREHTYKLAENIDSQLKRMVQDLREVVNHLNSTNQTQKDNEDPIVQIARILNAHMDSLQWIDQNSISLQKRVDEIAKLSEIKRKEQERNFRLAFD